VDPTSPAIHQAAAFGNVQEVAAELDVGWHGVCLCRHTFTLSNSAKVQAHTTRVFNNPSDTADN